jgi:hypothetical protein
VLDFKFAGPLGSAFLGFAFLEHLTLGLVYPGPFFFLLELLFGRYSDFLVLICLGEPQFDAIGLNTPFDWIAFLEIKQFCDFIRVCARQMGIVPAKPALEIISVAVHQFLIYLITL